MGGPGPLATFVWPGAMKNDSGAVAAVKARANIAEIVGRYVTLRPVGSRLVGPCPFHQETKGSFNVHPDKGFFHCFGCQASVDVIDFFCRINGLEFREGLERLAAEALPENNYRRALLPRQNIFGASKQMLRAYANRFQGAAHYYSAVEHGKAINQNWSKLRELRKSIADEQGIPAYLVFGDRTLQEMAQKIPSGRRAGGTWRRP